MTGSTLATDSLRCGSARVIAIARLKPLDFRQERFSIGRADPRQNVTYLRGELASADPQLMGNRVVLHVLPEPPEQMELKWGKPG